MALIETAKSGTYIRAESSVGDTTAPPVSDCLLKGMDWETVLAAIKSCDVAPTGSRIYVLPVTRERSSGKHGTAIYLPQGTADTSSDGVVISAGPLAYVHWQGHLPADQQFDARNDADYRAIERLTRYRLQPGDIITFARWGGVETPRWWEQSLANLLCMQADDVLGMVEQGGAFTKGVNNG